MKVALSHVIPLQPKRSMRLQLYGHAGGHLRDARRLEKDRVRWWTHVRIDFDSERHHAWWNRLSDHEKGRWLLGQLWCCSDVLPGWVCPEFAHYDDRGVVRQPTTYAQLVRLLAQGLI